MLHRIVMTPMKTHDLQHSRKVGSLTWGLLTALCTQCIVGCLTLGWEP